MKKSPRRKGQLSKTKKPQASNSVRVAVRVRPLKKNEIKLKQTVCVEMSNNTTIATDAEGKEHKYTFDYSYWSIKDGRNEFVTQEKVFNDLGGEVVQNCFAGYNSCIFAYGQTGSGKSYTIFGDNRNPGIVPRLCNELFETMKEKMGDEKSKILRYRIEVSMMEIYNEKVRDLFNPTNPKNAAGLKVRENTKTGPYVEGLTRNIAQNYEDLRTMLEEGSKLRTIGATNMNDRSSRAHTIFQIVFTQVFNWSQKGSKKTKDQKKKGQRVSLINIIDLAGSERQGKAQTTGKRLKEGAGINLSLSMLGNVINRLADNSTKKKSSYVPYRDSKLTWLLKESLGGNSKTIMIATISPAAFNAPETISTLRYANRAKEIQNHAVVNEDAQSKLINELRKEIDRLKAQLLSGGTNNQSNGSTDTSETTEANLKLLNQLKESQKIIADLQMTDEDRVEQTKILSEERKRALREAGISADYSRKIVPHLINLNEDPQMSESLLYFFKPNNLTKIGGKKELNEIVLTGEKVEDTHCSVENDLNTRVFLKPCKIEKKKRIATVFVNGKRVITKIELHTYDRIIIGQNHFFRFNNPNEKNVKKNSDVIDYEFMKNEIKMKIAAELEISRKKQEKKMKIEFDKKRKVEEDKIKMLVEKRKNLQENVLKIQEENQKIKKEEETKLHEIHRLEDEIHQFQKKLDQEQVQKNDLELESQKSSEKVRVLKKTVEMLRDDLLSQKEETLRMEEAHLKEKMSLENQAVTLQKTMIELQRKLGEVEKEKIIKEKEHEQQIKKVSNLKESVLKLESQLKNEIEFKKKLVEESMKLAKSEKQWKSKHKTTKKQLRQRTIEQAQLLPVLQQMMIAQDSTHRQQISILQQKLKEKEEQVKKIDQDNNQKINELSKVNNEAKGEFVQKLLAQIDEMMKDNKKLMLKIKEKENFADVKEYKSRIWKLQNENQALQQMNIQLDQVAKDRLDVIKVLEKNIQMLTKDK